MSMTKDDFLALAPRVAPVELPELGKTAHVRRMGNEDRIRWIVSVGDDNAANMTELLVRCLCDEQGKRLFADDERDVVAQFDGAAGELLTHAALRVNGLASESVSDAKKN